MEGCLWNSWAFTLPEVHWGGVLFESASFLPAAAAADALELLYIFIMFNK